MKTNKSSLFKIANAIYRSGQTDSFSDALKKAWKAIRLQAKLALGSATFTYLKAGGETRVAVGTLKNMVNEEHDCLRKGCENIMIYFDLEKKGFRSFDAGKLIAF